jgi:hypothetical protein
MLLDAGADPNGRTGEASGHGGWTPPRCAVAGAVNPLITRLLLERGAVPGDHDLYLAGFAGQPRAGLVGALMGLCRSSCSAVRCGAGL